MSYSCAVCGFELWHVVAALDTSVVGLADDDRFPGRGIVALREHYDHLDEVPASLVAALTADAQRVGRVLRETLGAVRVNYAVLGNTDAHVHFHVIPRYADDPIPTQPPWEHPRERAPLPVSEVTRLRAALVERL